MTDQSIRNKKRKSSKNLPADMYPSLHEVPCCYRI